MSLREVEGKTGISNAYLSQLENGRISEPSPTVLHKLSALYGISYETVLDKAGYPVPRMSDTAAARLNARFGGVTREEEMALTEYLEFLRSRRRV